MNACSKKTVYSAAYLAFVQKKPNLTEMKQQFKCLRAVYVTLGPYFV